ncbi:hypothetical protein H2136_20210 [Aeromonas hydrophila]|uniref:Uncharacterized protein n=1 Tax=Aeromonas hydrophila TaxID=644 RepID=A0A926IZ56_AERHY|nr:hypothetical protein [Aeromonas hydrophila]
MKETEEAKLATLVVRHAEVNRPAIKRCSWACAAQKGGVEQFKVRRNCPVIADESDFTTEQSR